MTDLNSPQTYVEAIRKASDEMNISALITIHDELVKTNITTVSKVMKVIKKDPVDYEVFANASAMSKNAKNGVFKLIVAQALQRENIGG